MKEFEAIKDKFWINIYHSDKPNAPLCNIEFVSKSNKDERYKYPVWRDKEKEGKGYIGKLDAGKVDAHNTAKANAYQPQDNLDQSIPF